MPRMYYTNFDHFITERYHVVLKGWPLEKFCSPSDIQSRNKILVLMKSLDSGATRFRKLSTTEFEDWSENCFNAKADSTSGPGPVPTSPPPPPSPSSPSPSSPSSPSLPVPSPSVSQESISNDGPGASTTSGPDIENIAPSPSQHLSCLTVPAKRTHTHVSEPSTSQRPLADAFINTGVTSANGATVMVTAKARKPRADKGKKRGPRTKVLPT